MNGCFQIIHPTSEIIHPKSYIIHPKSYIINRIYFISGLGADEKACSKLFIPGYTIEHIPWLLPLKNEAIEQYAARMCASVEDENPVLMGLSFGGMMAIEMAKLISVKKLILISTVKSRSELPLWMRICGRLKLNRLSTLKSYKILEPIQNYNLGISTAEEKKMVANYRVTVPPGYLNWAVDKVLNWQNKSLPQSFIHIHGDADRMFPIKKITPTYVIKNGGHFMIMNKAREVNAILGNVFAG